MKLTKKETRQGLSISMIETSVTTVHNTLVGSVFLTGCALAWGASDLLVGLLGSIPSLAMMFQLVGAYLTDRWPEQRKRLVAGIGFSSRCVWLVMALVSSVFWASPTGVLALLVILFLVYKASLNLCGPGWVSWMADLVPRQVRGRYFGRCYFSMEICGVVTLLVAGVVMDHFRAGGHERQGYAVLQMCAGLVGAISFILMMRQPDPGHQSTAPEVRLRYILRPLRNPRFLRLFFFNLVWMSGMTIWSSFLSAHLLKNMHWDFKMLAFIGLVGSLGSMSMYRIWGRLADLRGNKRVLAICAIGLLLEPLSYVCCPWRVQWPIYLGTLLGGVCLGGANLALFNLILLETPKETRAIGVAVMMGLTGPAVFLVGLLGGLVADCLSSFRAQIWGLDISNYQLMFLLVILLRLFALYLLGFVSDNPKTALQHPRH
jgi:MFS family permease